MVPEFGAAHRGLRFNVATFSRILTQARVSLHSVWLIHGTELTACSASSAGLKSDPRHQIVKMIEIKEADLDQPLARLVDPQADLCAEVFAEPALERARLDIAGF